MRVSDLSQALDISEVQLSELVQEKRSITADTAMRLARYFGTSERFWQNLQTAYELREAQHRRKP